MKSKLTRLFFGSASIALLACQAAAEGKISGITTKTVGDGLEVQVKGQELSAPKISRVMGGRSFMLEFDATMTSDPQWIRVEQGGVHYVQSVYTGADKIRIHLRLDPSSKVDVGPDSDGFLIKVHSASTPKPVEAAKPQLAPEAMNIYTQPSHLSADVPKPKPPQHAEHVARTRFVSLDFVNTEIVQILKALSLEAGVNVITSPDVKGSLTVSLGSVPIKEALDLITTMSGLKYQQVGNTYVVTTSSNFNYITSALNGKNEPVSETRVVPIYSGEATHIKDALKTTSNDVEILLPSEKALSPLAITQAQQAVNEAQLASLKGAPQNGANSAQQNTQNNTNNTDTKNAPKDTYLVLIGPSSRVDALEHQVKDLDEQMCKVEGTEYPLANVMTRTVYHPQGNSAATLLQAIAPSTDKTTGGQFHAKVGTVELYATPTGSTSAQNIVLYGRETEVNRLVENLTSIDQLSESTGDYVIYGVKYLDPRAVREDLLVKFPGLSVSTTPGNVGQPGLYQVGLQEKQSQEKVGQSVGETSQNANAAASAAATSANGVDTGSTPGLTAPFAGEESQAVPMRLVLRGSRDQIQNALAYLQAIDTEPKQVALELRVMELSKEDALNLGLNWSILTGGKVQAVQMNQAGPTQPTNTAGFPNTSLLPTAGTQIAPLSTPGTLNGVISGLPGLGTLGITAQLDSLADSNKMIARPNILALDGRESEMFVGDDVKYIQSIVASQNGTTVTTGDVEVGVKLAVLPRVGADGSITMDLRPAVSTLLGFTQVPGGGSLPQTGLRIAQSTMVVKSGDTIAIGGLVQDTDTKSYGGIPILKDIPILNLLFGRTNNDHKKVEVVFFLTAKVVDHESMANAANPYANAPAAMPQVKKHKGKH